MVRDNLARSSCVQCEPAGNRRRCPVDEQPPLASAPGNVSLSAKLSGLRRDSVANVSQILAVDRDPLGERAGRIRPDEVELALNGIDLVLGRA
jgi:mRNA interferase MazF